MVPCKVKNDYKNYSQLYRVYQTKKVVTDKNFRELSPLTYIEPKHFW